MEDEDEATAENERREIILHGFPVFPSRGGTVTHEQIKQLFDEEDEEAIARSHRKASNENDPGH